MLPLKGTETPNTTASSARARVAPRTAADIAATLTRNRLRVTMDRTSPGCGPRAHACRLLNTPPGGRQAIPGAAFQPPEEQGDLGGCPGYGGSRSRNTSIANTVCLPW